MPYNMNDCDGVVISKDGGSPSSNATDGQYHASSLSQHGRLYQFVPNKTTNPAADSCGGGRIDEGNGLAGRYQCQQQFHPPVHVPPPASTSPYLIDRSGFEQEKVSVRLVKNQGLVVEPDDDPRYSRNSNGCINGCRQGSEERKEDYDTTLASASASYLCSGGGSSFPRTFSSGSCSNSKGIVLANGGASDGACTECCNSNNNEVDFAAGPFSRTRHGSTSCNSTGGSGGGPLSSLTPLMDVKENHKIQVVMTSASKSYGNNGIHHCCALVFGFSASLFFSLTLLLTKVLKNRDHHPISIAFWRYMGILVPSIPIVLIYIARGKKHKVLVSVWPIKDMDKAANALALLMRGVLGSTSIILRFCSLKYLTIADSSVISYSAPVFAAVFAPFCLKRDKGGFVPILMGVVSLVGVFMVCRPPFLSGTLNQLDDDTLKGVFLASLSMLCASGVFVIMRHLHKVHFSLMMFILGVWGVFEAGVLAVSLDVLKVPELLPDIVMMFGVAILTFFGQLFVLLAMKTGQLESVSVMRSCDIFLSFLWQYLFLNTEPEGLGILSAILIILAVWFVSFRNWLSTLRTNNLIRKRFSFILY